MQDWGLPNVLADKKWKRLRNERDRYASEPAIPTGRTPRSKKLKPLKVHTPASLIIIALSFDGQVTPVTKVAAAAEASDSVLAAAHENLLDLWEHTIESMRVMKEKLDEVVAMVKLKLRLLKLLLLLWKVSCCHDRDIYQLTGQPL